MDKEHIMSEKTIIVMPAYNAERTVERIFKDIPKGCYSECILVDDCSSDRTCEVAEKLGITVIRHEQNKGYGGNQKTCYQAALDRGADYVIMLHPDYQYDARIIPATVDILRLGICDVILGNRIRTRAEALEGGMPLIKYLANRGLTLIENIACAQNMGELHSGYRAYSRRVLETIPFHRNSDDFVFDSQFLIQSVHFGFKLGDLPVPVRYFDEMSSINVSRASEYAVLTLWTLVRWYLHRMRIVKDPIFQPADLDVKGGNPAVTP